MSDSKVVSFDDGELFGVMGELAIDDAEAWMQVHDLLLDRWLEIYEEAKQSLGSPPPGTRAIYPVMVTAHGVICQHACPCVKDAEFMWGVPGYSEGSRHPDWRLIVSCEQCMRDSGMVPLPEVTTYDA